MLTNVLPEDSHIGSNILVPIRIHDGLLNCIIIFIFYELAELELP